jgi:hypothetical protein
LFFPEIGCFLGATPKKPQKTARFFRGFPGDFPGDFPGISRGLFSEKTGIFPDFFTPFYRRVHCSAARVLGKTPEFPEKFPRISGIPRNPRKKFPEIPGNSVRPIFGKIFPNFPEFWGIRITLHYIGTFRVCSHD